MTQPVCWSKKKRSPQMSPKWKHRHQQTKTESSTQHRCLISKINSAWRSFFLKTIWYVWAVFCLQSRSHPSSFNNLILLNVRQNTVKHSVYKCIIKWRMKQFDQNWWYWLKFLQQPSEALQCHTWDKSTAVVIYIVKFELCRQGENADCLSFYLLNF